MLRYFLHCRCDPSVTSNYVIISAAALPQRETAQLDRRPPTNLLNHVICSSRAPTPSYHVTSVSCEPAALSRPAADGAAKVCRQSASALASCPGTRHHRKTASSCAGPRARAAAGNSKPDERAARFASTAADELWIGEGDFASADFSLAHSLFCPLASQPSLAMPAADVSDRCCPYSFLAFCSL